MFGNDGVAGRQVGVGVPAGQRSAGTGSPRSVSNFAEMKTYAVEWVDENGQMHREAMHCIGGVWHRAPNGENYAATLRPINSDSWLVKLLAERIAGDNTASIPSDDAVDVIGDGTKPVPEPKHKGHHKAGG